MDQIRAKLGRRRGLGSGGERRAGWGELAVEGPRTKLDEAAEEASCSPRTLVRHRLLWWRSCPLCQPPQAQGWWPQWGTRGQWAAALQEGWPPPPSGTRRTPGFLPQHSLLQSPWLSSQPGERRDRSYLGLSRNQQGHLTLRALLATSFWAGDSGGRSRAGESSSLINSTGLPWKTERSEVERQTPIIWLHSSLLLCPLGSLPSWSDLSQFITIIIRPPSGMERLILFRSETCTFI